MPATPRARPASASPDISYDLSSAASPPPVLDAMTDPADNLAELDRLYGARGVHGRIVETIGRRVISGGFAAGAMLPKEAELMVELGASRTSIREAVKVLAAKGLLETRQKRGTIVRPQSAWNLLDPDILAWVTDAGAALTLIPQLGELRRLIEPGAVEPAFLRRDLAEMMRKHMNAGAGSPGKA